MPEFVTTEDRPDGIRILAFDRPEKRNALTNRMREEMAAAVSRANDEAAVKAVILTGAGDRAFSAGQDLAEAKGLTADSVGPFFEVSRRYFEALRRFEKPLVAAVNGACAGAGFQSTLFCDIRVGHPGIRIGQPEIDAGFASVIGSRLMELALGHLRTVELSLEAKLIDGTEAYRLGLLTYLVPQEAVMAKAAAVARALAEKPPTAFRLTKQAFREATQAAFDDAMAAGIRFQKMAFESGEPQRVMQRFLNC